MIETLPRTVVEAYGISDDAVVKEIGDGLVNTTYVVDDAGERTVLQRMAGMFSAEAVDDMQAVTERLSLRGWTVPTLVETFDGKNHVRDEADTLWRHTVHIDSDGGTPTDTSTELTTEIAAMLGRWHADMRDFDFKPAFQIPHFHDVDHQAEKTEVYLYDGGFEPADFTLASDLISMARKHSSNAETQETQIIHADPKLGNILFRDGKPLTLIDFDTVMRGSRWIDCGDFMRSVSGRLIAQSQNPDAHMEAFATSYANATGQSEGTTYNAVRQATGRIAANLGMRYMCDITDASYFKWDSSQYESRRDNHLDRAELQLQIAKHVLA